jgi:hypothetical protein
LLVVGRGDTLEDLEALKSSGTASGLVGHHTTEDTVEEAGGGTEVEGTTRRVNETALAEVVLVLDCVLVFRF